MSHTPDPKTLTEAVNLGKGKTEQIHLLGQVAGITKVVKIINRELMAAKSSAEISMLRTIIRDITVESQLLLKEAEQLTKPVTEEEKRKLTES